MTPGYSFELALRQIRLHDGYIGAFTRAQAPGSIPNGAIVIKQNSEPQDSNADGSRGVVLGSIYVPPEARAKLAASCKSERERRIAANTERMYWVEWNDYPRHAAMVVGQKIRMSE